MFAIEVAYEIRMWASLPNSTPGTTAIRAAVASRHYDQAFGIASGFRPAVDRFFTDIFVMVEDEGLKVQRLTLLRRLHELLLELADISEIIPHTES
jgi:glycyl-tRNA synthetase beta subunit